MKHTLLFAILFAPSVASSQAVLILDRGRFTITENGQRVGQEDFTISSTPVGTGVEYLSKATVVMGDRRLSPSLMTDAVGKPSRYQIEVRGTSAKIERWIGGITRGRVSARIDNPRGMSEREYVVSEGAILVDDDVFHQYYFLVRRAEQQSIAIVIPRRNAQLLLKAALTGTETLTIGDTPLQARHFIFTEPTGVTREVWVDAESRVLKVTIPSRGLQALREDPPTA